MIRVAILDDYARVVPGMADWSLLDGRCELDFFDQPVGSIDEAAVALEPYHVLCHLRERTAMPRALIERLPNLRLVTITGHEHRTLDIAAATARGVIVSHAVTRQGSGQAQGTPELVFGLALALARRIPFEDRRLRDGHWQSTVGTTLWGKTLGLVGLGRVGQRVAQIGAAFGMKVVAWSENLTADRAAAAGVRLVSKDELFATSDVVSLHLVLGERSRGVVGARELGLMKATAVLINAARGPLVDEAALVAALSGRRIGGAGLDVFWREPMPAGHPLTKLDNVVLTPHLGYVVEESFRPFYEDTVENIAAWLDGKPIRVVNPDVLGALGAAAGKLSADLLDAGRSGSAPRAGHRSTDR